METSEIIKIIKKDGIGILPTDTVYGLVGRALAPKAVERIFQVKGRSRRKAVIVLISSIAELKKFNVKITPQEKKRLEKIWPGQVSIILPCPLQKFRYLHRGLKTLAFRLPASRALQDLLHQTGPLVAPSANPEGTPPAATITQAKKYFGNQVDFYLSAGQKLKGQPSTLIKFSGEKVVILRKGAGEIKI